MDGILKSGFIRRENSWDNTMPFHIVLFLQRCKFGISFSPWGFLSDIEMEGRHFYGDAMQATLRLSVHFLREIWYGQKQIGRKPGVLTSARGFEFFGRRHYMKIVSLLTKLLTANVWGLHTKQFSRFYGDTNWVCSNLVQFWHSLLRVVQSAQVNGSVPQDCPSLQIPTANTGFPGDPHFRLTWLQTGNSYDHPPPCSFHNLL